LSLENDEANYEVFNVGTGRKLTIMKMGNVLSENLAPDLNLSVLGQFREGDIRHCYADISKIQSKLGYTPKVAFEDGISELVGWVSTQQADDMVEAAKAQLSTRNLVK
jgi:dTDP-L-rhamnose 4-epimerase